MITVNLRDRHKAAVVGRPDSRWQERPIAFVVLKASHTFGNKADVVAALKDLLADRFARWQCPDEIILVSALPRGNTGKIDKIRLREAAAAENGLPASR